MQGKQCVWLVCEHHVVVLCFNGPVREQVVQPPLLNALPPLAQISPSTLDPHSVPPSNSQVTCTDGNILEEQGEKGKLPT